MAFRYFLIVSLISAVVIPSAAFALDPLPSTNDPTVVQAVVRPPMTEDVQKRIIGCLRPQGAPKYLGDIGDHWSVGSAVSAQLVKYDLASKQVSFNRSIGVGASFRYYTAEEIDGKKFKVSDINRNAEPRRSQPLMWLMTRRVGNSSRIGSALPPLSTPPKPKTQTSASSQQYCSVFSATSSISEQVSI